MYIQTPGIPGCRHRKGSRCADRRGRRRGDRARNCHVQVAGSPTSKPPISVGHCRIPKAVCAAPGITEPPPHCVFRQIADLGCTIVVPLRDGGTKIGIDRRPHPGAPLPDWLTQNFGDTGLSGSGTRSGNTVLAVEKVEERLFVAGAAGFAQDGEIPVVSADLTLSGPRRSRATGDPWRWKGSAFPAPLARGRRLRPAGTKGGGDRRVSASISVLSVSRRSSYRDGG
jgi:hypothetical protein